MHLIEGGVCAARGFQAGGVHCGIRSSKTKRDLALIVSSVPATAAAVYTQNLVQGAPLLVTKRHLANGQAQAIICNSGIANTCCADGLATAQAMADLTAQTLHLSSDNIIVASTGVIGKSLNLEPIRKGMPTLVESLTADPAGNVAAAEAIMTTDTQRKSVAVSFELDGQLCHLGGIAKGSGMIHPNMATMLVFLTTDVNITPALLQTALERDVRTSFNMISIDGDTSTNDMCCLLANGLAKNRLLEQEDADFALFTQALNAVTTRLCRLLASDGEGASKLLECTVNGANNLHTAQTLAKSVISSSLVKTAMCGADANWGRILCAVGYAGVPVNVHQVDIAFAAPLDSTEKLYVCKNGSGVDFSEEHAKQLLLHDQIKILLELHDGSAQATAWGCDLTCEYVKINGDYRT